MLTNTVRSQRFVSKPRTPLERQAFIQCVVGDSGMRLELPSKPNGVLELSTSAQVAVLVELLTSVHRRLVEIEVAALPQGGADVSRADADALGAEPPTAAGGSPG